MGVNTVVTTIVSVSEIVNLIRHAFLDAMTLAISQGNQHHAQQLTSTINYNCVPYLNCLIFEIMNDDSREESFGRLSASTQILIQDGMSRVTAREIAMEAFRMTLSALTLAVPTITFGAQQEGYMVEMCGEYDLAIVSPLIFE